MRLKLVVKDPILDNPTATQMSATELSVFRRSAAALSRRRVSKYACGDSPNALRNARLKCAGDNPAAVASAATSSGSAYRASARSFARSRCRVIGTDGISAPLRRPTSRQLHVRRAQFVDRAHTK